MFCTLMYYSVHGGSHGPCGISLASEVYSVKQEFINQYYVHKLLHMDSMYLMPLMLISLINFTA